MNDHPEDLHLIGSLGFSSGVMSSNMIRSARDAAAFVDEDQHARFEDPLAWSDHAEIRLWDRCDCGECGGWEPTSGFDMLGKIRVPHHTQADIMRSVRDHRETYIHSGHGTGKTFVLGLLVYWWMTTFDDGIVVTTSPVFKQLKRQIWKEVRTVYNRLKPPNIAPPYISHWEIAPDHFAEAVAMSKIEAMTGYHSTHVLAIGDEGSGLDEAVYDAFDRITQGDDDRIVVAENPWRRDAETCLRWRKGHGNHIRLSTRDVVSYQDAHPSFRSGLSGSDWLTDRETRWGKDSIRWRVGVEGLPPEEGEEILFPPELVEAAMERYEQVMEKREWAHRRNGTVTATSPPDAIGMDVAGEGRAKSVQAARWSQELIAFLMHSSTPDLSELRLKVERRHEEISPGVWIVDASPMGKQMADEMARKKIPVDKYVGGEIPRDPTRYFNRRAEAYHALREFLDAGGALPPSADLRQQLGVFESHLVEKSVSKKVGRKTNKKMLVVNKITTKEKVQEKLNGVSPDDADACAMACAPTKKVAGKKVHGFRNVARV